LFIKEFLRKAGALYLTTDREIAEKVNCPLDEEAETCHWLNYILAQLFERYRVSKQFHISLLDKLDVALNPPNAPDFVVPFHNLFKVGTCVYYRV
jgi:hypothetical protein